MPPPNKLPRLMGIVNVTPDSFSDGGQFFDCDKAVAHARLLIDEGADIIDIGGESTRPGATPVETQEEIDRVLPVIEKLQDVQIDISIDTRKPAVMRAAIQAGARIINDVSALSYDEQSIETAAGLNVPVVLMHAQGLPQTMQKNPRYDDVVEDVFGYLKSRIECAVKGGIARGKLIVDPGIGFGKTTTHNLALLKNLRRFRELECPVLVGLSRKRFISEIAEAGPEERLPGSLAGAIWSSMEGADILRVHDVVKTRQALAVWQAIAAS